MEKIKQETLQELSKAEITQRVNVLKRFKKLLEQQREKFQRYLEVLEAQEVSIESENVDNIVQHAKLGQSIVSEIASIKKVIDPLEDIYKKTRPTNVYEEETKIETEKIKRDLQNLQANILLQNEKNRDKLKTHLVGLRKQVASIKSFKSDNRIFSTDETGSIIDFNI